MFVKTASLLEIDVVEVLIYSVRELLFCFSNILFITFGVAAEMR